MVPSEPGRAGRPTEYTEALATAICERIANGESLIAVVRDDDMPCRRTVFRWLNAHPEFEAMYRLARTYQAEYWSEEMIEIARDDGDDTLIAKVEKTTKNVVTVVEKPVSNNAKVQRDRLKIDTLRAAVATALPSKYGKRAGSDNAMIGTPPAEPVKRTGSTPLSAAVLAFERKLDGAATRNDAPARGKVQDRG